jgi:hypothetical protein
VNQLRQLERRSGLNRMIAIGRLILEQFFDGSAAAWRERRKNKNNSVRRLAQHPSCPLSHSSLNQALGVYVTVRALPSVQTFKHVGACHIIAVLHLTEAAQLLWLERAEEELWSVRQLKAAVLASRRLEGERRGRPKTSVGRARVAKLKRSVVTMERGTASGWWWLTSGLPLGAREQALLRTPVPRAGFETLVCSLGASAPDPLELRAPLARGHRRPPGRFSLAADTSVNHGFRPRCELYQ